MVPSSARTSTPAALLPRAVSSEVFTRVASIMLAEAGTGTWTVVAPGPGVSMTTGLVVQAASVVTAASANAPGRVRFCMQCSLEGDATTVPVPGSTPGDA